jgi:hypothetical protein
VLVCRTRRGHHRSRETASHSVPRFLGRLAVRSCRMPSRSLLRLSTLCAITVSKCWVQTLATTSSNRLTNRLRTRMCVPFVAHSCVAYMCIINSNCFTEIHAEVFTYPPPPVRGQPAWFACQLSCATHLLLAPDLVAQYYKQGVAPLRQVSVRTFSHLIATILCSILFFSTNYLYHIFQIFFVILCLFLTSAKN